MKIAFHTLSALFCAFLTIPALASESVIELQTPEQSTVTPIVLITHTDGSNSAHQLKLVTADNLEESHFELGSSVDLKKTDLNSSFESTSLDRGSMLWAGIGMSTSEYVSARLLWMLDFNSEVSPEIIGNIGLNGITAEVGIGSRGGFWIWSGVFGASIRAAYHYAWSNLGIGFQDGGHYVGLEGALRFIIIETDLSVYRRTDSNLIPGQTPWTVSGGVRLYLPMTR